MKKRRNTHPDVRLGKFISLILRHAPETVGIQLDEHGWVDVDALLNGIRRTGRHVTRADLERIVAENDKQRYTLDGASNRIRANQGHSLAVNLELQPRQPPAVLYHGTVQRFLDSIRTQGLLKGSRQHVHLSAERDTAVNVGQRRGRPVILEIDAPRMHAQGYRFFLSDNGVWLTEHVPATYIAFP